VLLCAITALPNATIAQTPPTQPATTQTAAAPGQKLLTIDDLFGGIDFNGSYESGQSWLSDGRHYLDRRNGREMKVDALSGDAEPAYDVDIFAAALKAAGDFDDRTAERLAVRPNEMSDDRSAALVAHKDHLYVYRFADQQAQRITQQAGSFPWMTLSPRSGYVSFVRDHDLYCIDVKSSRLARLTTGGSEELSNADLDWVYAEEVYSHRSRGYWWRGDEAYIAYLQLDEKKVPRFTVVDHIPTDQRIENVHYPQPGDPNPGVRLGVVTPRGGATRWVDLSKYADGEILIVRVGFSPAGKLIYQVQDREQRWLDLNEADPATGQSRTLLHEASPAWADVLEEPRWLADGGFLWFSQRDGWRHLYRHDRDGKLVRRLTGGDWEARGLEGVDEKGGWVYVSGTRDSPVESNLYRVRLDVARPPPAGSSVARPPPAETGRGRPGYIGSDIHRLTEPDSDHDVRLDPTCTLFIDTFSNIATPPKVHLRRAEDGSLARVISENEVPALSEYKLSTPQLLRVPARDGYLMNALLVLPPDLDPSKKYPVWSYTYSGPHAPSVRNNWRGGGMEAQMLAQQGYIGWICDNRSASGQGAVSAWQNYLRLGESELADLEDGIRWLVENYPADPQRVGIWGHSYGGFQTCYSLTHSTMFKIGYAGAPVTDWRLYDSIYTERYMLTPQNNAAGYDETSPIRAAANLQGKLLIMHGAIDDNVHFQNTVQFINALLEAGKQPELMIYPRARHGLTPRRHATERRLQFLYDNL
jgi:dipeptidyl-peptidase-4